MYVPVPRHRDEPDRDFHGGIINAGLQKRVVAALHDVPPDAGQIDVQDGPMTRVCRDRVVT